MGTERLLDIFSFNNDENSVHGNTMDRDNDDEMYREEYSSLSLATFLEWFR